MNPVSCNKNQKEPLIKEGSRTIEKERKLALRSHAELQNAPIACFSENELGVTVLLLAT